MFNSLVAYSNKEDGKLLRTNLQEPGGERRVLSKYWKLMQCHCDSHSKKLATKDEQKKLKNC